MNCSTLLRSPMAGAAALVLVLAACGSDGDDTADTTTAAATESTEAATTDTTAAAATEDTTAAADPAAAGQAVDLTEWSVTIDGDVAAGGTSFAITNSGENPHALAITVGDAYESLPLLDNGAVDTDTLGDDFVTSSENVEPGASATLDVTLEAGNYVFFCPIAFGPNSHAGQGQVLSVTVS
jgi:uncharacterized cupredoxin-like copper-binding protein